MGSSRLRTLLPSVLLALFASMLAPALAAAQSPSSEISLRELTREIAQREDRVAEFKFIREEAERLGVRVWLFGGTAAGYAHYVRWNLRQEAGDSRYQPDRFDYDYTNIFRSTQDLDVVIDGSPEQARELERALTFKFPHFQGARHSAWEVRLLRQGLGDKEALLGNFDFIHQHTDSHSTGMIELTRHEGEEVVRDLRDWDSRTPQFLHDVQEARLHYYFSARHLDTHRAAEGLNPPILSAVRYLTKAFQYELKLRPEDLERVREVIAGFEPGSVRPGTYVAKWLEKNGKKLIQNAVNIEYAARTIRELGLDRKLSSLPGAPSGPGSLAWWLQRQPLETKPVGKGAGPTAAELGLDVLAHETSDFQAYESITRAHTGDPNVLISRKGVEGEAAEFGEGFYTRVGREGARHTGFTIRFRLRADAREGTDFQRAARDFVIIHNKAAVRVIPESVNWSLSEYFDHLMSQDKLDFSDGAVREKLRRRLGGRMKISDPAESEELERMLLNYLQQRDSKVEVFAEWLSLPGSEAHSGKLLEALDRAGLLDYDAFDRVFELPHWSQDPRGVKLRAWHRRLAKLFRDLGTEQNGTNKADAVAELAAREPALAAALVPRAASEARVFARISPLVRALTPEYRKPRYVTAIIDGFPATFGGNYNPYAEKFTSFRHAIRDMVFAPDARYDMKVAQAHYVLEFTTCSGWELDHIIDVDLANPKAWERTQMVGAILRRTTPQFMDRGLQRSRLIEKIYANARPDQLDQMLYEAVSRPAIEKQIEPGLMFDLFSNPRIREAPRTMARYFELASPEVAEIAHELLDTPGKREAIREDLAEWLPEEKGNFRKVMAMGENPLERARNAKAAEAKAAKPAAPDPCAQHFAQIAKDSWNFYAQFNPFLPKL